MTESLELHIVRASRDCERVPYSRLITEFFCIVEPKHQLTLCNAAKATDCQPVVEWEPRVLSKGALAHCTLLILQKLFHLTIVKHAGD